jgi:predicted nucleic acid-binding protein
MIILDTNVLSALMLDRPPLAVAEWLDRQPHLSVWTTSITVFEVRFGLNSMPAGRRRAQRIETFERILANVIEQRIALFDSAGAERAAELAADRRKVGRPGELRDTMIAGIVLASHAKLATRNVKYFEEIAASVVNPWDKVEGIGNRE